MQSRGFFHYFETEVKLRPLAQLIKETFGFFLRNIHMAFGHMNLVALEFKSSKYSKYSRGLNFRAPAEKRFDLKLLVLLRSHFAYSRIINSFLVPLIIISTLLVVRGYAHADSPQDKSTVSSPAIPVRLILVKNKQHAEDLIVKLTQGVSFADLAKKHSIHSTAIKYGLLGRVSIKDLGSEYQNAIRGLSPGEFTPPFETQSGFAILYYVNEKRFITGIRHFEAQEHQKAVQALTSYIKLNPDSLEAYHYLGLSYQDLGRSQKAVGIFRELIAVDPKRAEAHNNLGNALFKTKKYDEAIESYSEALVLSPSDPVIMNNLAWVLAKRNRSLDIARKLVDRALTLRPKDPEYWDTLTEVLLAQGLREEALTKIDKAIELGGRAAYLKRRREGIIALIARGEESPLPTAKTKPEKPVPVKSRLTTEDLKSVSAQDLPGKKDYYSVQIGAFRSFELAEKLTEKFRRLGFTAHIDHRDIPSKGSLHRVRLGPYDSMSLAKKAAGKVETQYNMDSFITHETR